MLAPEDDIRFAVRRGGNHLNRVIDIHDAAIRVAGHVDEHGTRAVDAGFQHRGGNRVLSRVGHGLFALADAVAEVRHAAGLHERPSRPQNPD